MGGGTSLPVVPSAIDASEIADFGDSKEHFVHLINSKREIRFAPSGVASKEHCPPSTLIKTFESLIGDPHAANLIALRVERPMPPIGPDGVAPAPMDPGQLTTWTYKQYYEEVVAMARGLLALGFVRYDNVCIFGFNAPEWMIAAFSGIFAGGSFTGIYPSDTPEQIEWKAKLSNSSVIFVEDEGACNKVLQVVENLPYLRAIVHWNASFKEGTAPHKRTDGSQVELVGWAEAKGRGAAAENGAELRDIMDSVQPTDCADLIFTSGTTGNPKAVMISHDNLIFEGTSLIAVMDPFLRYDLEHRMLSYLPLSHIAGALLDIFFPIITMTKRAQEHGCHVTFARPYDLKAGSLVGRLHLTRPTMFLGVPRVWEKIMEKLIQVGKSTKGVKRKIITFAKNKALQRARGQQLGGDGKIPFGYETIKGKLLVKIKEKLGLDECLFGFTGAAPMKVETFEFFAALGIDIQEIYGMSETTGAATGTTPASKIWGSVGFPMPGVEVEVFDVDPENINNKKLCPRTSNIFAPEPGTEGEICFRGRNIMLGYLANPALGEEHVEEILKKNRAVVDDEGWLHSGDKGCKDLNNMMRVTGRFKELIIGAGGENIAPVPIEDDICKRCAGVSNIMMVGDKRKFNVALLTLKAEGATGELPGSDELDKGYWDVSPGVTTISGAAKDPVWIEIITQAIQATNKNGAVCPSNAARIQKFTILPCDLSVQGGEFTPTLKLKRSVAENKYLAAIERMYESKETYVPFSQD